MASRVGNIAFDCDDVLELAQFWSAVVSQPVGYAANVVAEHERRGGSDRWTGLQDPEGNEATSSVSWSRVSRVGIDPCGT